MMLGFGDHQLAAAATQRLATYPLGAAQRFVARRVQGYDPDARIDQEIPDRGRTSGPCSD